MSKNNIIGILVCLFSYILSRWYSLESLYVGGHDTFQYIEWARTLGTDSQNFKFFRPLLYGIIKTAHEITEWDPRTFKSIALIFGGLNVTLFYLFCLKLIKEEFLAIIATVLFVINSTFLIADILGHISQIEMFFALLVCMSWVKVYNGNSKFLLLTISSAICLTLIHEDKLIFCSILIFLLPIVFKKRIIIYTSYIFPLFAMYIWLQHNSLQDSFYTAASIGTSWNSPMYFLNNITATINSVLQTTDPFSALIFFIASFIIISKNFKYGTYHKAFFDKNINADIKLYFSVLIYLVIVGLIFSGIDLPRTTGVVLPIALITVYKTTAEHLKRSILLTFVIISSVHNIFYVNNFKFDIYDSGVFYENTVTQFYSDIDCNSIRSIHSRVDTRSLMWGSDPNYGLRSKVYFYECFNR